MFKAKRSSMKVQPIEPASKSSSGILVVDQAPIKTMTLENLLPFFIMMPATGRKAATQIRIFPSQFPYISDLESSHRHCIEQYQNERIKTMKKNKLFLLLSIVTVLLIGIASVSYAATAYNSPAEIIAGLTGKSGDQAAADRQAGKTYGAQAVEAGKLDEFKAARLDLFKQNLDQAVADGRISQADADSRLEVMEQRLADCTGDGLGLGSRGMGRGAGQGMRAGMGRGTCTVSGTTANP